jgi:hypothetical protein
MMRKRRTDLLAIDGIRHDVGSIQPPPKIDEFAPLAAKGSKGRLVALGRLNLPVARWTLKRDHEHISYANPSLASIKQWFRTFPQSES